MKKQNFLDKLRKEGRLELIEPSKEMKLFYLQKAENFLIKIKVLINQLDNDRINQIRDSFEKFL